MLSRVAGLSWIEMDITSVEEVKVLVESRRTLVDWNCWLWENHKVRSTGSRVAGLLWIEIVVSARRNEWILCRESQDSRGYYNTTKKYISTDVFYLWYDKQCINLGDASPLWSLNHNRQPLAVYVADIWWERYITLSRGISGK